MMRQLITRADNGSIPAEDQRIVFTLDAFGYIRTLNAAGERLTGFSFAELRRMNVTEILSAVCAREIREQIKRSLRNRVGTVFEVEIVTKDGRHLRIETSLDLVKCPDGTIEFQGIALPPQDLGRNARPRCLDERFVLVEHDRNPH